MATRKDLLKAHAFVTQRLKAALVNRRPDDPEQPLRRLGTGVFASTMIGVLVVAGFGVVGLVRGGSSTSWQDSDAVIVNSDSGAVYAYIGQELYPAANITSARLATGGAEQKSLKSRSLVGFPEQNPIGIPGAPEQLPAADALSAYPLRVCSTAVTDRSEERFTTVEVGSGAVPGDSASFAARDSAGQVYLITDGRKFATPTPEGSQVPPVLSYLGFTSIMEPGDRFLNTIPAGGSLEPLEIPKAGERSMRPPSTGDTSIGALFHVAGATTTHYVLLEDGLAEIAPLESAVLASTRNEDSTELSASEAARVMSDQQITSPEIPRFMPQPDTSVTNLGDVAVCLSWSAADSNPRLALDVETPEVTGRSTGTMTADTVVMPTLHGALVTTREGATPTLLTEAKRFGIATPEDVAALGYAEVTPDRVPTEVMTLLPEGLGPGGILSQEAARQPLGN